ncbi:MAG TPA: hypothetical protein VI636_13780 [Candidatus Angelobacter sp.]
MGKEAVLLLMLAEAIGLMALYCLLRRLSQFTKRTWDDVPEFLRQINHEAVKKLFDAAEEREALAFGNSRRALRCRLDLAREYLRSLHHNVTIVYQWGETEWQDMVRHHLEYDEETRQKMLLLHREAVTFLVAARVALVKTWIWSVVQFEKWPVLPLASVADLRTPGSVDLLHAYQRVKEAAAALASVYGEEHSDEIGNLM